MGVKEGRGRVVVVGGWGGGGAKGKGREGVAMILCQTPNILPSGGRCRKAVFGVCACVSQFSVCVWRAYVCVCVCVCVCVACVCVCVGQGRGHVCAISASAVPPTRSYLFRPSELCTNYNLTNFK